MAKIVAGVALVTIVEGSQTHQERTTFLGGANWTNTQRAIGAVKSHSRIDQNKMPIDLLFGRG